MILSLNSIYIYLLYSNMTNLFFFNNLKMLIKFSFCMGYTLNHKNWKKNCIKKMYTLSSTNPNILMDEVPPRKCEIEIMERIY